MKDDGIPFNIVLDSILDTTRVIITPSTIIPAKMTADNREENIPVTFPTKNMEITDIKIGSLPLQGTKLLVMIAMKRSLGESMMRQPMMPAALQPNPMHIVCVYL